MLFNIQLLDGATMAHNGTYYTAALEDDSRLTIKETFTGLRCSNSDTESAVLSAMVRQLSVQSNDIG